MTEADGATAERSEGTRRRRRWGLYGAIGFIPFLGVLVLVWLLTALGPAPVAEYALVSGGGVDVARTDAGIEFAPSSMEASVGIVMYPGARIEPESYAALAREFVEEHGALFVITPMTFNMAILSPDRAADVIAAHPDIETWALVGHSLGGVAACDFVATHPDAVDALVLLASYPDEGTDLSDVDVDVLSITASEDAVLDREAFEAGRDRLPADATYKEIEGGNHAQFGDYGDQPGDGTASISAEEQRRIVIEAVAGSLGLSGLDGLATLRES